MAAYALREHYSNAEKVEKIIIDHATVAAAASAAGGIIPVLAIPSIIVSCFGAVWSMYIQICKCLDIKLKQNVLKVLASAAVTNISINLVSAFAAELLMSFIPGASILAGALITFACLYLSGLMFMKMILAWAKEGKVGADIENMSEEDLKASIEEQTPSRKDVKEAKKVYNDNK